MLDKLKNLLQSRKFYAAMITAALTFINGELKIVDGTTMITIVGAISAWIVGQAIVDSGKND